jgi:hypothetical protein
MTAVSILHQGSLLAQQPDSSSINSQPTSGQGGYTLATRARDFREWQHVIWTTNSAGRARAQTNSYTEIATGMARSLNGNLVDSSDQISVTATGAQGTQALHKVSFLGNVNSAGAIDITSPDGNHLVSNPLGLSYYDTATGNSVMIAEVKDSNGQLLPSGNEAIYPNAFTDFDADLIYQNSIAGFEQFVVLRQKPPPPGDWGLNPATTLLQVITEFQEAPVPQLAAIECESGTDTRIDFGAMQMMNGQAFAIGSETNRVPVTKQWQTVNGRTFLIEQVPLEAIAEQLVDLPPATPGSAKNSKPGEVQTGRFALGHTLPKRRVSSGREQPMKIASYRPATKGFAIDYTLLNSQTNLVLQSDTTYYVSGVVNINGTLTIEGGTVVKYTNSTLATITSSNVVCKTAPYRMAIFTSKDDNSLGLTIGGSTGSPSGYYGNIALDVSTAPSAQTLSGLRFRYMSNALAGASVTLQDAQFVSCRNGFASGSTQPTLYNVLFYLVNTFFANSVAGTLTGINVTGHYCTNFFGNTSGTVRLTNCVFAAVTNWQCTTTQTNFDTILTSDTGIFQTVGAGAHYLAADSPYRNAGTATIPAGLLSDLRKKTTYPPIVMSPQNVYVDTALSPQAQRDTDSIDLGMHYDPIDFAISGFFATNCSITVNPGTAVAVFGTNVYTYGFGLSGNARLTSVGTPNGMVELTAFNTVQEQATTNWISPAYALITDVFIGSDLGLFCRFTDFTVIAQDVPHFYLGNVGLAGFQDCQLHGGQITSANPTVNFTNCLLERVNADIFPGDGVTPWIRNNLVWYGTFGYAPSVNGAVIQDNLFDHASIPNEIGGSGLTYNGGFNAYVTNFDRLQPTFTSDIILASSPSYQTGPLGGYYLQNSSSLINAATGTTADQVGLYHYTVMTNLVSGNEIKETNSVLDVSYHYVATDLNGVPIDTNGDGVPDYQSDVNGNGTVESGEIAWKSGGDLGLKVLITRPKNGSTIP